MEAVAVTNRPADLAVLIDARIGSAYRLARAVLLDDGEAEDAVQEACVIAWQKQSSLRDPGRLVRGARHRRPGPEPGVQRGDPGRDQRGGSVAFALTVIRRPRREPVRSRTGRRVGPGPRP